ncbi:hypothetical protein ACIHCV_39415 [Streptomyces sp. NPDC051956]|uniref:hypothetical protein n=1 Tax=Streptomyces sp. NPDC051956 TaxID=3365677 RepID=UPI0037CCD005
MERQFGHRARLVLVPAQAAVLDAQGHAARAMWTNVFVSDVYLKGGDNNAPLPGLPVC